MGELVIAEAGKIRRDAMRLMGAVEAAQHGEDRSPRRARGFCGGSGFFGGKGDRGHVGNQCVMNSSSGEICCSAANGKIAGAWEGCASGAAEQRRQRSRWAHDGAPAPAAAPLLA